MIEYVCPVCGKKFIVSNRGGYLYKVIKRLDRKRSQTVYYCGYNCMRKENPDKKFKVSDLVHARHM